MHLHYSRGESRRCEGDSGQGTLAIRARKAAKAAKDSVLHKGVLDGMRLQASWPIVRVGP